MAGVVVTVGITSLSMGGGGYGGMGVGGGYRSRGMGGDRHNDIGACVVLGNTDWYQQPPPA